MNIDDKRNAVNARLAERMAALDRRLSDRFGTRSPGRTITGTRACLSAAVLANKALAASMGISVENADGLASAAAHIASAVVMDESDVGSVDAVKSPVADDGSSVQTASEQSP